MREDDGIRFRHMLGAAFTSQWRYSRDKILPV